MIIHAQYIYFLEGLLVFIVAEVSHGTQILTRFKEFPHSQWKRKKIFYLMVHSSHGVGHMVKDQSDTEKSLHGLFFPISSKGFIIYTIPDILLPLLCQLWSTGWNKK